MSSGPPPRAERPNNDGMLDISECPAAAVLSSLTAPPRKEGNKVLRLIAHEVIGLMSNMQATIGLAGLHVGQLLGK